jgi:hypothetical protein
MASGAGIEPTRLTAGLATVPQNEPLGNYPLPDPFHTSGSLYTSTGANLGIVTVANDFLYASSLTDVTSNFASGTLSTTVAGGVALYTPTSATAATIYKAGQFMQFVAGQKLWFTCRVAVSALTGTSRFGLQAGSGFTADSLMFVVAVTTGIVSFVSIIGSATTVLIANVGTLTAATMTDFAYYYDGNDVLVYVGGSLVGRVAAPTIGTNITSVLLTPAIQSTPAATETTSVDFFLASAEIAR